MDDSLDDFFAKKDKSKKKSKSSKSKVVAADLLPPAEPETVNLNVEDVANKVEDIKIEEEKKKKSKRRKDKESGDPSKNDEDEWNDMNEVKDYSGLRIATKNITKRAEEEADDQQEPEYDEDGQIIEKNKDGTVWKVNAKPEEQSNTPPPPQSEPEPLQELAKSMPTRYVPPSMRAGGAALEPISMKRQTRRQPRHAPNLTSETDFPTLGAAPPPVDTDTTNFEKVRGGSRDQSNAQVAPSRVVTSNMYSALDN